MAVLFDDVENEKQLVVILSRNYSTGLSVVRALGRTGYEIDLVASALHEGGSKGIAASRYVRNSVEIVSKKLNDGGEERILNELLKYKNKEKQKPILLPTDDFTAAIMDTNREALKDIFLMPGINEVGQGSIIHYMDKSVQGEIARKTGFLTPSECTIDLRGEFFNIPETINYPCYVKPLQSFRGYKQEMKKCDTLDELKEHLTKMKEKLSDRTVLVQDFLEIEQEINVEGVSFNQEVVLPGVVVKDIVAKNERGVTLAGKILSFDEFGSLKEDLTRLVKEYHYNGLFDIDINIVNGKYYFSEMNLRSGGTNFVYLGSQVNLPAIFVKQLLGEKIDFQSTKVKDFKKKYVYEKMVWDEYLHDNMSKNRCLELIEGADIRNYATEDDPLPDMHFAQEMKDADFEKTKKANRKACIEEAMEATGWDEAYAKEQIKDARKRLGITYKNYKRYKLWEYAPEEQAEAYERLRAERQLEKAQKKHMELREHEEDLSEKNLERIKEFEEKLIKMEAEEGQLVVILSRNYSTGISVIRSIGSAGFTVDLVASAYRRNASAMASASKYVRNSVEVVSKKVKNGDDIGLIRALMAYAGKTKTKPILFPTDDYTTSIMDMSKDILKDVFIMPGIENGPKGYLTKMMDKIVQAEIARKVGFNTPKSWVISLRNAIFTLPNDIQYPCFCKPIESVTGYKKEMAACNSEAELKRHLRKLRRNFANRSVLVQEFLNIDNEIDLSGVCLKDDVIIPAIIKKTNVAQYEKGVTLAGKVVPFEELGELQEKVIALMKEICYYGMFDLELNVVEDKIYFNEINFRSGGPNYSYFASGVNLPALFVKDALGESHTEEEEKVSEYGKSFVYEQVAWDDYIHGFMTKRELNKTIDSADVTLLCNADDPAPGDMYMKRVKRRAKRKRLSNKKKAVKRTIKKMLFPTLRKIKHRLLGYPQTKKKNARDPQSARPRVIVSGRNYSSNLCIARSLGKAGYEVEVLRIFQVRPKRNNLMKIMKPDAYSKYIKAYHVCVSRRRSKRIVKALIKIADLERKQLLVPADDLVAAIADDFYDELKEYYIMPNVDDTAGEINRLMAKGEQKALAKEAGLPVLNSCVIQTLGGKFEIPDSVTYPCFIKPNVSKNSAKSKMRRCDSQEELEEAMIKLSKKKDVEMLVEDYVEIKKEYSILGVSTKHGANGPAFFVAEEGGQEEHRGVAVRGKILEVSEQPELVKEMVDFVSSLKFDGLYDIDLIETMDGEFKFVEINMRFGASGCAFTDCGINLPGMFADYMLEDKPIDFDCKITKAGSTFVSEKVLIEEYMKGRLSKESYKEILTDTDIHMIMDDEDKKPYNHFKKFFPIASIYRRLYIKKEEKRQRKLEKELENEKNEDTVA